LDRRRLAAVIVSVVVLGMLPDTGAAAATPEPASATDISVQAGLYQVTRSWSANVADYDGDGDPDLFYVPHNEMAAKLYRNDGGVFTEVFLGTFRRQDRHDCAWGDANVDGRPDIYCSLGAGNGSGTSLKELWIQNATGGFTNMGSQYGVTDPYGRGRWDTFIDVNHDAYPDLFTGSQFPRTDGVTSPNRLYLNDGGTRFVDSASYGLDLELGADCAQAADVNGDGWDDLLVCGQKGLHLYLNQAGTSFVDASVAWGVASLATGLHNARLADLNRDGEVDLAFLTKKGLAIYPQADGTFGAASFRLPLVSGQWIATGDFQGDGMADLYVVQSCRNGVNDPDYLLLGDGTASSFSEVSLPNTAAGCGDMAEPIDIQGDGLDEFIVLNGFGETTQGPVQLITSGPAPISPCTISGTSGNDAITGTSGDDYICGFSGNDTISGNGGQDVLVGGDGTDVLNGGDGNDELQGEAGNDTLDGGPGDDAVDGGVGRDIVRFTLAQPVIVDMEAGTAGGQGADVVTGFEVVQGSLTADTITGSAAAETLNGLGGNDSVTGRGGADQVIGGGGNDTLNGVDSIQGNDTVDGKAGTDTCTADQGDRLLSCP